MLKLLQFLFFVFLVATGSDAYAQKQAQFADNIYSRMWQKDVIRSLYFYTVDTAPGHRTIKQQRSGPLLSQILIEAAQKGQVQAYAAGYGQNRGALLTHNEIMKISSYPPDTVFIDSPQTGMQYVRLVPKAYDYQHITSCRLLEHWVYNATARQTEISTESVAFAKEVYGDDGTYRGSITLFWIPWKDAMPFIKKYKVYDSINSLENLLWSSYFRDSSLIGDTLKCRIAKVADSTYRRYIIRPFTVKNDDNSDIQYLKDKLDDSMASEVLISRVLHGSIQAYKNWCGLDPLSMADLRIFTTPAYDTFLYEDPVTGENKTKIVARDYVPFYASKYLAGEVWEFNTFSGQTTIKYSSLAPVLNNSRNSMTELEIVFAWIKFRDVIGIYNKYAGYPPEKNIEWMLWTAPLLEKRRYWERELFNEQKSE